MAASEVLSNTEVSSHVGSAVFEIWKVRTELCVDVRYTPDFEDIEKNNLKHFINNF
jgi:hypothetical protein